MERRHPEAAEVVVMMERHPLLDHPARHFPNPDHS
jgi:hypothetical protein